MYGSYCIMTLHYAHYFLIFPFSIFILTFPFIQVYWHNAYPVIIALLSIFSEFQHLLYIYDKFTISQELEQGQVDGSFPAWILLQGDAITSGGKHFPTANGHQLAALIFASHVIQNSSIIDKGIQFPSRIKKREYYSDGHYITVWLRFGSEFLGKYIFTSLGWHLPCFEAVKGILYSLLVVFDHVGVHLGVVTPYVALCAAIWDCTKAERRVLLLWLLKLSREEE